MSVLSQSFFALMSRHLMSLFLLSARHNLRYLLVSSLNSSDINNILLTLYGLCESLGGLESRDVMFGNDDSSIL